MMNKFTSKEIHFLKTDSETRPINPPETYFSDLLHDKAVRTVQMEAIEARLAETKIPGDEFICALIRISKSETDKTKEKAKDVFEACFHSVLDKKRGIWERLDDTAFVLVFWDYDREKEGYRLLSLLKEKISTALKADILMGIASFPFHDFKQEQILGNALKAIDHAAFFGTDHVTHFDAVSLNISGDRLYQLNQHREAIKEYQRGLEIDPKNINLLNSLGVGYGVTGQLEKARQSFEKASAISPEEVMVIYNIGLIHRINEKEDKAVIYLKKAHAISPDIFEVELLLGYLLFKQENWNQAMKHLQTASRLNEKSGLAFRMKGEIFLNQKKDPVQAGVEFNRAVKQSPSDAIALSGYAQSMKLQNKNLKIAETFAKKSVSLEPENILFKARLKEIQDLCHKAAASEEKTIKSA